MGAGRAWTTSEVRILQRMREQRFTYREIGAVLGRTEYAITEMLRYVPATRNEPACKRRVDRLSPLPKPPKTVSEVFWTDAQVEQLKALADQQMTAREAAFILGRTYHAVRSKASYIGVQFRGRGRGSPPKDRTEQESFMFRRNAEEGSAHLLKAILRAAA